MTTAHRPTWKAAVGASNQGGWVSGGQITQQFSARDLPGHTKLKLRQLGQGTINEVELLDLKAELERKEKAYEEAKEKEGSGLDSIRKLEENRKLLLKAEAEPDDKAREFEKLNTQYNDADVESDESSDSDSDSDDEEAALMRELEKIKKEREEERKQEEERTKAEEKQEFLSGNPLTQDSSSSRSAVIKRRWNDDVVFKNQSRNEPEVKKRFINDTIRNDFHRSFLNKYMK